MNRNLKNLFVTNVMYLIITSSLSFAMEEEKQGPESVPVLFPCPVSPKDAEEAMWEMCPTVSNDIDQRSRCVALITRGISNLLEYYEEKPFFFYAGLMDALRENGHKEVNPTILKKVCAIMKTSTKDILLCVDKEILNNTMVCINRNLNTMNGLSFNLSLDDRKTLNNRIFDALRKRKIIITTRDGSAFYCIDENSTVKRNAARPRLRHLAPVRIRVSVCDNVNDYLEENAGYPYFLFYAGDNWNSKYVKRDLRLIADQNGDHSPLIDELNEKFHKRNPWGLRDRHANRLPRLYFQNSPNWVGNHSPESREHILRLVEETSFSEPIAEIVLSYLKNDFIKVLIPTQIFDPEVNFNEAVREYEDFCEKVVASLCIDVINSLVKRRIALWDEKNLYYLVPKHYVIPVDFIDKLRDKLRNFSVFDLRNFLSIKRGDGKLEMGIFYIPTKTTDANFLIPLEHIEF